MIKRVKLSGYSRNLLIVINIILVSACQSESEIEPDTGKLILLDQSWSPQQRAEIHHKSFGSRLIPLDWYSNMLDVEGVALADEINTIKWGFIPSEPSQTNPKGLPIGFTLDKDENDEIWLGLGCAACHTGMVEFKGQQILLEGGQGLVNFTLFETSIKEALKATLESPESLAALAENLRLEKKELAESIKKRYEYLENRQKINFTEVDYGYGRLDAFGQIFNTVGAELLKNPENALTPDAPVSYPVLWNAPHLDLVQWNGSAPNSGPGPLFQNVTTAIAVFGQMEVVNNDEFLGYKSTVNIPNLKHIQEWLYHLESPKWPEVVLGKLDGVKVERGEKIYQQNCIQCHQLVDRSDKKVKLKATLTPITEVGTDPTMVENFLNAKVNSGILVGKKVLWLAGDKIAEKEKSINLVAHVAAGAALNHPLQTLDAVIEDYHSVYKAAINPEPNYYKARPLTGIWASSPYLHNGSVLTLEELLSPVENRRQNFYVGSRELDLERVGLVSSKSANASLFDTNEKGNSNAGHLYGTNLTANERSDLLEYLKSL